MTLCPPELLEAWPIVVGSAMHFNEMLVSYRSIVAGIMPAIIGAAALSMIQIDPKNAFFKGIHFGVYIVLLGLAVLFAVFLLDMCYYFQLLLGAVDVATDIESNCDQVPGLTGKLSHTVQPWRARLIIYFLYGVAAGALVVLAVIVQMKGRELRDAASSP